jgi:cyclopropane fatty-acyl-phospholipid synthase-like methyltransferase
MFELLYILLIIIVLVRVIMRLLGAPWIPSSMEKVRKMLSMADVQPNEIVYDLGSGDGRIIILAAREFGAQSVGIEANPFWVGWTRVLLTFYRLEQVRVEWGNFFHKDLREANVVTLNLLQETTEKLQQKLEEELQPGTRVVSHTFTFPQWTPETINSELYLYKISDKKS